MTNARQIKQVFRPLLQRHDDLFQVGTRWLCVKPVHHVALRILIEPSPHADYAFPQWVMLPTFLFDTGVENNISYHFWHLFRESIEDPTIATADPRSTLEINAKNDSLYYSQLPYRTRTSAA